MIETTVSFAVCDDDEIVCAAICDQIRKVMEKFGYQTKIDKYVAPLLLYKNLESGQRRYDAVFLDIDMPKVSGIDLARTLKKMENAPDIIFVSNREDLVFDTFSVRPYGFIRKNNFTHDLVDTLRSYIRTKIARETYVAVRTNSNTVVRKIRVQDIVYIESFRYKQYIYMADEEVIECRQSMEEFEKNLAQYDIVRIYKGYLVNLKYVQRIERTGVLLNYKDGVTLMVSRDKVQDVKAQYLQYLRKMGLTLFDGEE